MTDIDKRVATEIMGWAAFNSRFGENYNEWCVPDKKTKGMTGKVMCQQRDFNPSKNISDAFLVVERMRELGFYIRLRLSTNSGDWICQFINIKTECGDIEVHKLAPMAICLAALECFTDECT